MPTAKVFASLRQVVGAGEITFAASTVREFLDAAVAAYGPAFAEQLPRCTVLVNGSGLTGDELDRAVGDADEIAILPPVGGGGGDGGKASEASVPPSTTGLFSATLPAQVRR